MGTVFGLALVVVGAGLVALVVYVVREATVLKTTSQALQSELRQFKEGGFDHLISEKLARFTEKAAAEIEQREQLIQQRQAQLLEEGRKAAVAAQQFSEDLGKVTAELQGLRDLQSRVGELNDLLKPQQLRGELGEVIVRTLIADKLPPSQYDEDHVFADGKQVEFTIRLNDKLIAVDSKLQLEDFKRMRSADERQRPALRGEFKRKLKLKIDEVKQYIRPEEGTYPFAIMVIPSEAVYYEVIAGKDFIEDGGIYEYALQRNVFVVSPSTFWAYLSALAHGLRGLEIERQAEQILASLQSLAVKIHNFSSDEFRVLGVHLTNAAKQYESAERKLRAIDDDAAALERAETKVLAQEVPL